MYKKRRRQLKSLIFCAVLGSCFSYAFASDAVKPAAGTFPVVDPAVQRERDETRKQILEDELATEVQRLVKAKSELTAAEGAKKLPDEIGGFRDALRRHEANVASLNQELARMGQGQQPKMAAPGRKVVTLKAAAPLVVSKYDGYQKAGDQEEDPYDGYAVSSSE